MSPIRYWVSPIWSDLLRFGQIWSDLVIRVTDVQGAKRQSGETHIRITPRAWEIALKSILSGQFLSYVNSTHQLYSFISCNITA